MIKKQKLTFIFHTFVVVAIVLGAGPAAAQSSEPKTVADFLLLVPDLYMDGYDASMRNEMVNGHRRGVLIDIPNGYISYDESDNPSGFEFAIFRKSNGGYLVAYSTGAFSDPEFDKESGNWPVFILLSYEAGDKWRDVTRQFLPAGFDTRLAYKLPRYGRSIEAWDERSRKSYTLNWRNDSFLISRRRDGRLSARR